MATPPHRPAFDSFLDRARVTSARCLPVFRCLTSDELTPVLAFARVVRSDPAFLFESVVGGEIVGRFSFLGAEPFLRFEARGDRVTVRDGNGQQIEDRSCEDPLAELQRWVDRYRAETLPGLPRFLGGAVGYAAYDSVRYTEHLPGTPEDDRGLPDLVFDFYDRMVLFDHIRKTVTVVAMAHLDEPPRDDEAIDRAYRDACGRIDELVTRLGDRSADLPIRDVDPKAIGSVETRSNFSRADFEGVVERCKEYIRAGDIFQVVPSQRFEVETTARPFDIYRALRIVNPSPFLFYLPYGDYHLIGSSPEILVRVEDGEVTIRPLAGTRKRGANEVEDLALAEDLLADPKERAEHIMLVDLARNDVGTVSRPSTVVISEIMTVERYSHVMHISSNIHGTMLPGKTALDALRAGLPAGTVSGAPKIRAMEIIDEVEPTKRGPYGGAVGYIDFTGNMDTCLALRTIVVKGSTAYLQAGCGVVYDSVPASEYEETVNKARGLLAAIDVAQNQIGAGETSLPL